MTNDTEMYSMQCFNENCFSFTDDYLGVLQALRQMGLQLR